jgi:hypothetical protein
MAKAIRCGTIQPSCYSWSAAGVDLSINTVAARVAMLCRSACTCEEIRDRGPDECASAAAT